MLRTKKLFGFWRNVSVMLCCALTVYGGGAVQAISQTDLYSINTNTPFFDPSAVAACSSGISSVASSSPIQSSAVQKANAQIIIGVAKTENLGQQGALIGLLVGLDESNLRILANTNVPLSESNPNKQGDGSDHYSLGVMQQQITTGWSTISNDPNDAAAVNQLMDAAYNAEAFFGSPSGSNAPNALSKGLQNVHGWQSMDPWVAAQAVQISGDPTGSNYKAQLSRAQSLLSQYYDSSPAVPLPVPLSGGSNTTDTSSENNTGVCGTSGGVVQGSIVQTAINLAWDDITFPHDASWGGSGSNDSPSCTTPDPDSSPASCHHGFQQLGVGNPNIYTTQAYQDAIKKYNKPAYDSGIYDSYTDCGVFVATVIHASGADPNYPSSGSSSQLYYAQTHPDKYMVIPDADPSQLQPGDIMVSGDHTYIYVGKQADGYNVAEASQDNHSPEIDNVAYNGSYGFSLVRLKQ